MPASPCPPAGKALLVAASLSLLNGCVVLLPNGGGLQARMSSLKTSGDGRYQRAASSTPSGVEALSGSLPPRINEPAPSTPAENPVQTAPSHQAVARHTTGELQVAELDTAGARATVKADRPKTTPNAGNGKPDGPSQPPARSGEITLIPAKPGGYHDSLWERLADGFDLDGKSEDAVEQALHHYTRHPRATRRMLERGRPYLWEIAEAVASRDMPMELALLPAIESGFNPMAESHRRALGLWQLMPGTADHLGLEQNWWFDGRLDMAESTHAALNYLEYLYRRFDDWTLALAAYNCGEARLQRAIGAAGGNTDFWELSLPEETRNYIPRLLALAELIEDPEDYGIRLPDLPDQQTTDILLFEQQVDLALVAEQGGVDLQRLQFLNPGLQRWATPPDGPHRLRVPAGKSRQIQARMQGLPLAQWTQWQNYLVREGDSLGIIAQRHGIRTQDLKSINGLNGDVIRAGQSLQLPSSRYLASLNTRDLVAYPPPLDAHRIEYQVKSGDTLWEIARMFKVSIEALTSWNGLQTSSILRPGKKLVVWVSDPSHAARVAKG